MVAFPMRGGTVWLLVNSTSLKTPALRCNFKAKAKDKAIIITQMFILSRKHE